MLIFFESFPYKYKIAQTSAKFKHCNLSFDHGNMKMFKFLMKQIFIST